MNSFSDIGFVISGRKHGEKYKIVEILTKSHGRFAALTSDSKNGFSLFSKVEVEWSSKSRDLMGFWKAKSEKQNWIYALNSQNKMTIIQSICYLLHRALPERVPYEKLFEILDTMFQKLKTYSDRELLKIYAYLEFVLLKTVGFGFDFKICGICNKPEKLSYIIKENGISASESCVSFDPTKHFKIPEVWYAWNREHFELNQEIQNSLQVTLYFIRKNIFDFDVFFRVFLSKLTFV